MKKPLKALSIRQPWAWLILNGGKDVENRSWSTPHRGPFLIHAPKAWAEDYEYALNLAKKHGIIVPPKEDLPRGGIVGQATLTDSVDSSKSTWHYKGAKAFLLKDVKKTRFLPCAGRLGFFIPELR